MRVVVVSVAWLWLMLGTAPRASELYVLESIRPATVGSDLDWYNIAPIRSFSTCVHVEQVAVPRPLLMQSAQMTG